MMQTEKETVRSSAGSRLLKWIFILAMVVLLATVVNRGINSRIKAASIVKLETADLAIPVVSVTHPRLGESKQELVLPGNLQAFTFAPIYARTSGYLKKWYFDIGARVKTGQVLAEIEAPELDQQLSQAKAQLATAQANLKLAEITMNRDLGLMKDAIPKQDVDNAVGAYEAGKATVQAQ